jgi:hypothetical protein
MANYFTLEYEDTANTSPGNVVLNYGSSTSDGLTVHVSLYAGPGFTATQYKMWGLPLAEGQSVVTEENAQWQAFTPTATARLARTNNPQSAYVIFKDASDNETATFQSNEVTFGFIDPIINSDVTWATDFEALGFNSATANRIFKSRADTGVNFNKSDITQLSFSGRNFTGLRISDNAVYVDPDSEIGKVINLNASSFVTIDKQFTSADKPIVTVSSGTGTITPLTDYNGSIRSTVSGYDVGRISNISWDAETKKLTFRAYKFSTYGFATIQKVEFTADSQTAAYVGDSATFKVYVQDTDGNPVEGAPVTISGVSGNIGTIEESIPQNTNADGLVTFTLDVSSEGSVEYSAHVDTHFTANDLIIQGIAVAGHQRSLLTQYDQIRRSATYDDSIAEVNSATVAEPTTPTVSGSSDSVLEHDMNVLRTLLKQVKGTTNWFDASSNYFDPTNTDINSTENKETKLSNFKNNTLDSKTMIVAVSESNSGAGFSLTPGDDGFLFDTTLTYALPTDRRGLPIFKSTTNSGTYWDEGGDDRVVGIDIIDMSSGGQFKSAAGDIVSAKFEDGVDHSGSGSGTDVYVKLYTDAGPYTTVSGDPTSVMMVYPFRKVLSNLDEYEWQRTDFVSSWEGDAVLVDRVKNLWSYTGALNNEVSPDWTVISGSPMVDSSVKSLRAALDTINDDFGDRTYTEQNYITNGQTISASLDALDTALYSTNQSVAAGIADKYVVILEQDVSAGTAYTLPGGVTYTPDSTEGKWGANMDIWLNGQLLFASTGDNGINEDGDYSETSSTEVTFHFDIYQNSNLSFKVRT